MILRTMGLGIALSVPSNLRSRFLPKLASKGSLTLRGFLQKYPASSDIQEITSSLLARSAQALKASKAALLVSPKNGNFPSLLYDHGVIQTLDDEELWDQPLVSWLALQDRSLGASQVETLPQWKEMSSLLNPFFRNLNSRIYGPLHSRGVLIGLLILGPKTCGKEYSSQEIQILDTICCLVATQLENGRLARQLESQFDALALAEEKVIRTTKLASLGHLVTEVAHEISNSLQSLYHLIYTMSGQDLDKEARRSLELVASEVAQSKLMMQELLSFARISESERQKQDVHRLLESVLQLIKLHPNANAVEIRLSFQEDPLLAKVSAEQLKQVFYNIVSNAFDAMATGGVLLVRTSREGGSIAIEFSDTGPGVPKELRERIFEPFYTTKASGKGTGLGLSISQDIVASHGGCIEINGGVGEGTSVIINLPTIAGSEETNSKRQEKTAHR